jgi:hypothetical protein
MGNSWLPGITMGILAGWFASHWLKSSIAFIDRPKNEKSPAWINMPHGEAISISRWHSCESLITVSLIGRKIRPAS